LSLTDPQIICLQAIHYLTLSLLVPPFLTGLATPSLLEYSGGSQTVAHIMDWREMAARPAVDSGGGAWKKIRGAWAGGKKVSVGTEEGKGEQEGAKGEGTGEGEGELAWDYGVDDRRGWIIGVAWIVAAAVE
jgi:hypothetical protein